MVDHEVAEGGTVYGPVASRRLGRSLGIDLSPPRCRVCTYDCVYCELVDVPRGDGAVRWPSPGDVESALCQALAHCGELDSITISGRGEPTLHPRFGAVAAAVVAAAHRGRPGVPVRILTNATGAVRAEVRRGLDLLDERIVVLDAAPERVVHPRPCAPLGGTLQAVARLRDVSAQSCFVEGAVSNTDEESVAAWIALLAELRPRRVFVYTIHRPAARPGVRPASARRLGEIAAALRKATGLETRVAV